MRDFLFSKGGSSGGARPKMLTKVDGEDWIIKFQSPYDSKDMGRQEFDYAMCAKECGIEMENVRLFPSECTKGYFGTKRFDCNNDSKSRKIHMVSASGLLETSHRIPNLDYDILMQLTLKLTKSMEECEKLYRLMSFNVYAHNRDDHSKNFTYLYDEDECCWKLSPAYDLTYSNSIGGEHATTVNGNGVNPDQDESFSDFRDKSVQDFRFALSEGIRRQVFFATVVQNIETQKIMQNSTCSLKITVYNVTIMG